MEIIFKKSISHCFSILIRFTFIFLSLIMGNSSMANCGINQNCSKIPIINKPPISTCNVNMCFANAKDRENYEKENNCVAPDKNLCGEKKLNQERQCCVDDFETGEKKIKTRQQAILDKKFNWEIYRKECVNMQQSEAAPDRLWQQCLVGQPHARGDDYPIIEVIQNGKARPYCIDGCSSPQWAVKAAQFSGNFIFADRNNPTGGGQGGIGESSSFLQACSKHDKCYQTCSNTNQAACDESMLSDMVAVCMGIPENHRTILQDIERNEIVFETQNRCLAAANSMYSALRSLGSNAFNLRRQQYCQCC